MSVLLETAKPVTEIKTELVIESIVEIEALKSLKEVWNSLLELSATKAVELTYEWQTTYWKHFNHNSHPFVLIVKKAGSIVAIAPLKITFGRKFGMRSRALEFMAAKEGNYQDFIIGNDKEETIECIFDYLVTNGKLWDVLSLDHIPENSTTAHFFLSSLNDSLFHRITDIEKCIFLNVDQTWGAYAKSTKRARDKIAYRMRKLQRVGELNYFHCSNEEQLRANLLRFFELHRRRWNKTDTPSQFNDNRNCQFYLEVSRQLLPKRQIDLFVLEVGKIPVALLFTCRFDRRYTQQLTAYDLEYARLSPSLIMHELFVQHAFADGIEVFDFGYYYPYKELWANRYKNRLNIEIFPRRILSYYFYILTRTRDLLRAKLRRNVPLLKFAKYTRRTARFLTGQYGTKPKMKIGSTRS